MPEARANSITRVKILNIEHLVIVLNGNIVELEFQTEPAVEKTLLVPLLTFNDFR